MLKEDSASVAMSVMKIEEPFKVQCSTYEIHGAEKSKLLGHNKPYRMAHLPFNNFCTEFLGKDLRRNYCSWRWEIR